jgi:hypothetical protein
VVNETASFTPPGTRSSGAGVAVSPVQLTQLTLKASLDDGPIKWNEVAFIPAGDAFDEIGVSPCSDCVLPVPASLAVASDGSLWIADALKSRIVHFSNGGVFLGAVPVMTGPSDLAFVRDRLYVLPEEGRSAIAVVADGRLSRRITVNHDGKHLHVQALIGGQKHLTALIAGAGKLLGGYWAFAIVDPVTGDIAPARGASVGRDRYVNFVPVLATRAPDYEITWSDDGVTTRQVVRFQLVRHGNRLRTAVGDTYIRTSTPDGAATLVSLADGQGLPVGRWYLEISSNGRELIFERVPQKGFMGDALRYLTVGDEGRIYWMTLLRDGLHVYRR